MQTAVLEQEPAIGWSPRRWWGLGVLCLGLFIVVVDNTILNVALPTIQEDAGATAAQLKWIVDAFTLMFAGFMLVGGSIGDRFGRRSAFFGGLTIFAVASVVAAFWATSPSSLIGLRGVMGLGAALVMPATLSLIDSMFPAHERPKAIAVWAAVSGVAIAAGPLLGGWLLEHAWWGSIFLVNVPVAAVAIIAALMLVPNTRDPHAAKVDYVGASLSVSGLLVLVWGIIEGAEYGWTDGRILTAFVLAAVLLGTFIRWELRSDHPMVDVRLFRNPRFGASNGVMVLLFFALFGSTFFLTQHLQFVMGLRPLETGVRLMPLAVAVIIVSPLSPRLVSKIGTKATTATGMVLCGVGLWMTTGIQVDSGYGRVAAMLAIIGLGMGLTMPAATDAIMESVPTDQAGVGAAMNDTTRELGGALGVAVLGSILTSHYTTNVGDKFQGLPAQAREVAEDSLGGAVRVAAKAPGDTGASLLAVARDAFVGAMHTTARVGAVAVIIGAAVAVALLPSRRRTIEE
jgi:EmrB/QacA subfamily drug resistance transporter